MEKVREGKIQWKALLSESFKRREKKGHTGEHQK